MLISVGISMVILLFVSLVFSNVRLVLFLKRKRRMTDDEFRSKETVADPTLTNLLLPEIGERVHFTEDRDESRGFRIAG